MTFRKRQETTRPFDAVRRTTCGNCPTGCGLKIFMKAGQVVDILGDEEHPGNKGSVCPKGLLTYWHLGNGARLTRPRIRERLSEPFRSVGWDEALDFVAKRLQGCVTAHGRDSVAVYGEETDPFDYLAGGDLFARALGSPLAPARFFPGPFGPDGAIARMFGLPAAQLLCNSSRDWCNSRCILLYGGDIAASDPLAIGPVMDARDRGALVLSLGSSDTVTAAKATMAVRVRPGTESVFLRGALRRLLAAGKGDPEFLAEWTEDEASLRKAVQDCTDASVARICGVAADELARFAEILGQTHPVSVIAGDWFSRRSLTDVDLWSCAALVALTGSLGIPGGGLNLFGVSPFSFQAAGGRPAHDLSLPGLLAGSGSAPAAVFLHGDPALPGLDAAAALGSVELAVCLSQYPGAASEAAHVSIPLSGWLEYDGLLPFSNGRLLQTHRKVMDAPGECRPAYDFWRGLALAMGLGDAAAWADGCAAFCDAQLRANPLTSGVGLADLDPETNIPGGVLWPCPGDKAPELERTRFINAVTRGLNILFERNRTFPGTDKRFPTVSGRVSLAAPISAQSNPPETQERPLRLVVRPRVDRVAAWGGKVADGPEGTMDGVRVNPRLALALGLRGGDALEIEAAHGGLRLAARLSDDVAPDVLWVPEGTPGAAALFAVPERGAGGAPFAAVAAHKAGADREAARRAVAALLARNSQHQEARS